MSCRQPTPCPVCEAAEAWGSGWHGRQTKGADPRYLADPPQRQAFRLRARPKSVGQSFVDDLGGLGEHLVQSLGRLEGFGVHLVDVLGAGRTGREPVVLGGDLQAADLGVVARGFGELGGDVLAGQLGGCDVVAGELGELLLLLDRKSVV